MLPKSQKYGQNNKNTSEIGGFFLNASIYELTRINTGDFGTLNYGSFWSTFLFLYLSVCCPDTPPR